MSVSPGESTQNQAAQTATQDVGAHKARHLSLRSVTQHEAASIGRKVDHTGGTAALWLVVILIVAAALRLQLFMLGPNTAIERADQNHSHRDILLGQNLVKYWNFGVRSEPDSAILAPLSDFRTELGQTEPPTGAGLNPEIYRTPLYPSLIGAVTLVHLPLQIILILQCLIGAATVFVVFRIGRTLFRLTAAALIAAAIVAVHPANITASNALSGGTIAFALFMVSLYLTVSRSQRDATSVALGGLSLGVSTLVQPVAILFGPVIAAWMFLTDRRFPTLGLAAILATVSLAVPGVWMARNYAAGSGARISSAGSINAYFGTFAQMRAVDNPAEASPEVMLDHLRAEHREGEDVFDAMNRIRRSGITDQPGRYFHVAWENTLRLLTSDTLDDLYGQLGLSYARPRHAVNGIDDFMARGKGRSGWIALVWTGFNLLLVAGAAIGLTFMAVRRRWSMLFLLLSLLGYCILAAQTHGFEGLRLVVLGLEALAIGSLALPAPVRKPKDKAPRRLRTRSRKERAVFGEEPTPEPYTPSGRPI